MNTAQGFKLISLGLTLTSDTWPVHPLPLRLSGVWYPYLPPANICLNQPPLDPVIFGKPEFKPLFWKRFGGTAGRNLCHLTAISANVAETGSLTRLIFEYGGSPSLYPKTFGYLGTRGLSASSTIKFTIDGPGGELIDCVDLLYDPWPRPLARPDDGVGEYIRSETSRDWTFYTIKVYYLAFVNDLGMDDPTY